MNRLLFGVCILLIVISVESFRFRRASVSHAVDKSDVVPTKLPKVKDGIKSVKPVKDESDSGKKQTYAKRIRPKREAEIGSDPGKNQFKKRLPPNHKGAQKALATYTPEPKKNVKESVSDSGKKQIRRFTREDKQEQPTRHLRLPPVHGKDRPKREAEIGADPGKSQFKKRLPPNHNSGKKQIRRFTREDKQEQPTRHLRLPPVHGKDRPKREIDSTALPIASKQPLPQTPEPIIETKKVEPKQIIEPIPTTPIKSEEKLEKPVEKINVSSEKSPSRSIEDKDSDLTAKPEVPEPIKSTLLPLAKSPVPEIHIETTVAPIVPVEKAEKPKLNVDSHESVEEAKKVPEVHVDPTPEVLPELKKESIPEVTEKPKASNLVEEKPKTETDGNQTPGLVIDVQTTKKPDVELKEKPESKVTPVETTEKPIEKPKIEIESSKLTDDLKEKSKKLPELTEKPIAENKAPFTEKVAIKEEVKVTEKPEIIIETTNAVTLETTKVSKPEEIPVEPSSIDSSTIEPLFKKITVIPLEEKADKEVTTEKPETTTVLTETPTTILAKENSKPVEKVTEAPVIEKVTEKASIVEKPTEVPSTKEEPKIVEKSTEVPSISSTETPKIVIDSKPIENVPKLPIDSKEPVPLAEKPKSEGESTKTSPVPLAEKPKEVTETPKIEENKPSISVEPIQPTTEKPAKPTLKPIETTKAIDKENSIEETIPTLYSGRKFPIEPPPGTVDLGK